jgi:DNA (cytosine-5)-methyltransferase 1
MYKKCEEILSKLQCEGKIKISDYQFSPKQELQLRLKDMLEDEVDEKYYLDKYLDKLVVKDKISENDIKIEATIEQKGWHRLMKDVLSKESICTCLNTMQGGNLEPKVLIKEATKQGYKEAYDGDSVNLAYPESETRRGRVGEQISQTLQCNDNMGVVESYVSKKYSEFKKEKGYIPELFNPYNQKEITDIAPTQSTQCGSTTSSATVLLKSDLRIRKLTPKECWRLMGFSDDDFEKANKVCSDSQLYKQAGNSIVVVVLEHIFMSLFYGI